MVTLDPNSEDFQTVVKPQTHKKAKTTPNGALRVKLEIKMELQLIFSSSTTLMRNFTQCSR